MKDNLESLIKRNTRYLEALMVELGQIEISFEAQRFFIYTLQSSLPEKIRAFDCYGTYVITPDFHPRRFRGDGYAQ